MAGAKVLDPACGGGRFLLAAHALGARALHGVDSDPMAVEICRYALRAAGASDFTVEVGDPLRAAAEGRLGLGGFDLVVGNPPYRAGRLAKLDPSYRDAFRVAEYQLDPYPLFLELALRCAREGGRVAMVVPNTWPSNLRAGKLRALLLGENGVERVLELPETTFAAGVETHVVQISRGGRNAERVPVDGGGGGALLFDPAQPHAPLPLVRRPELEALVVRSREWRRTLGEVGEITRGVNPYHHSRHSPEEIAARIHHADRRAGADFVPELRGRHLDAYRLDWPGDSWIRYGPWLKEPRHPRFFDGPRLLVRKILGDTLCAAYIDQPFVCDQSIYVARLDLACDWPPGALLACVNSRVVAALLRARHQEDDRLFPQLKVAELRGLPLPPVDPAGLAGLSDRALALQAAWDPAERERIERDVAALYGVEPGAI